MVENATLLASPSTCWFSGLVGPAHMLLVAVYAERERSCNPRSLLPSLPTYATHTQLGVMLQRLSGPEENKLFKFNAGKGSSSPASQGPVILLQSVVSIPLLPSSTSRSLT